MKRKHIFKFGAVLLLCACTVLFSSCFTLLATAVASSVKNTSAKIPFEGQMNPMLGYENLPWGITLENAKKAGYPIISKKYDGETQYYLGYTDSYGTYYYSHGDVNKTSFEFHNNRLYAVFDEIYTKNPTMEYLHSRYGDFNEVDVASAEVKEKYGWTVYVNDGIKGAYNIRIIIDENGTTTVNIWDRPAVNSLSQKAVSNTWQCFANTNGSTKFIYYTFLNINSDGKALFVGYSESLDSPARSMVRAGICWMQYTGGRYEIKTPNGMMDKKFDSAEWICSIKDKRYTYTYNSGESARVMLNFFLQNDSFDIRHNNTVSSFSNCTGLAKVIAAQGITMEELDFAIGNEEF